MYASGNKVANTVDPLALHSIHHNPSMLALNPTRISYIIDVVSWPVRQQDKKNDMIPTIIKTYPA